MRPEGVTLAQLVVDYERQCTVSYEIIAAYSFDDFGQCQEWAPGQASLRWMLHHMLEETARARRAPRRAP